MNTYKFTGMTICGHTDVIVQNADTLDEAKVKAQRHIFNKHTPIKIQKIEVKNGDHWFRI